MFDNRPRRVPVNDQYDDDTTMEYDGDDTAMDIYNGGGGDPPSAVAVMNSGGVTSNGQLRETQISRGIAPTYALQDTHTTTLPFLYAFSMVGIRNDGALRLSLNCTDVMNPVTFTSTLAEPTAGAALSRGFWKAAVTDIATWSNPLSRLLGISNLTPAVSGHDFWKKIYEYYTVLSCHYTLTVAPQCFEGSGITGYTVGEYEESYSTSTGNGRMPTESHIRARHNEGIKWNYYPGAVAGDVNHKRNVLSGSYRPGQAETNVRNDTDVKTWNLVSQSPILTEGHNFIFYRLPEVPDSHPDERFRYNCTIEMKFVVQYKDRITAFKFPGAASSAPDDLSSEDFYAY